MHFQVLKFAVLAVFFGVALTSVAHADDLELSKVDCSNPKGRTENTICINPEVSDADAVLGRVYQIVRSDLSRPCIDQKRCEEVDQLLVKSERRWLEFRDSFCELEVVQIVDQDDSDKQFGSCLLIETRDRTEELRIQRLNFQSLRKPSK